MQGVGIEEMKAGDQPVIGTVSVYQEPGVYSLEARHLHLSFMHDSSTVHRVATNVFTDFIEGWGPC